jgi:hypothetical protein
MVAIFGKPRPMPAPSGPPNTERMMQSIPASDRLIRIKPVDKHQRQQGPEGPERILSLLGLPYLVDARHMRKQQRTRNTSCAIDSFPNDVWSALECADPAKAQARKAVASSVPFLQPQGMTPGAILNQLPYTNYIYYPFRSSTAAKNPSVWCLCGSSFR